MFGDTLLDSSSTARKGKRWPMATAFTAEAIIAGLLVIIPLLSTGVIPISARAPVPIPIAPVVVQPIERVRADRTSASDPTSAPRSAAVVLVSNNENAIHWGPANATTTDPREVTPPGYIGGPDRIPDLGSGTKGPEVSIARPKRIVSQLTEAQLVNRIEPVYPHIAVISGVQGQVKLHAIIARDGSIQSLNAISGHPLLVRAAMDAVQQWRYRPYVLNGEVVEVETFITVNFRKDAH